jgi:hypothetical protein
VRRTACSTVAAGLVLGGALTGCGAGSSAAGAPATPARPSASPLHIVQAAYTKTVDAGTLQFDMNGTFSSTGMDMKISASGVEDLAHQQADVTMTIPILGKMEARLVGGVVYEKTPAFAGITGPAAGKWVKITEPEASDSDSDSSSSFDANEMLKMLKGLSSTGVAERGQETVRGTSTTQYSATLDLKKLAAAAKTEAKASGLDSADASLDFESMMKNTGLSNMPVNLFIDAQGRIRRMSMSMTVLKPSASPTATASPSIFGDSMPMDGSFSMTMDFLNFGVPVHVTAPPADQITDDSDVLSGLLPSSTPS